MPGQITHILNAQQALNKLPQEIYRKINANRRLYNIGSQGPDIYFYYLPSFLNRNIRGIGSKLHKLGSGPFFAEMVRNIQKMENKTAAFAYLSGYVSHYCLDCAAHPYVYYKTGFKRKGENIPKIRFSAYHIRFESAIDTIILKLLENKKPSQHKFWQNIEVNKRDIVVANAISRSINKAYKMPIKGNNVLSAMRYMALVTRLLNSTTGRKKRLINIAENAILGKDSDVISALIHEQKIKDGVDYLNTSKLVWKAPWDETIENNLSFLEMFETAADNAAELINELYNCVYKGASPEVFLDAAGDKTLFSGMPASEKIVFKYYDIIYKK